VISFDTLTIAMPMSEWANLATSVGVIFGALQLWMSRQQAMSQFEDSLVQQYREIVKAMPLKVLFGEERDLEEIRKYEGLVFQYVDLCNQQIFLRSRCRIRRKTWTDWCEGIRTNLGTESLKLGWNDIKKRAPESFAELRRLEEEQFQRDPLSWSRYRGWPMR